MQLAHQGGWDELVFIIVPVGLFALLLFIANQRAKALAAQEESERDASG